jgi:hypothetical protein
VYIYRPYSCCIQYHFIIQFNLFYAAHILSPVLCDFSTKEKSKTKEYRENLGEGGEGRDEGKDGEIGGGREEREEGLPSITKNK